MPVKSLLSRAVSHVPRQHVILCEDRQSRGRRYKETVVQRLFSTIPNLIPMGQYPSSMDSKPTAPNIEELIEQGIGEMQDDPGPPPFSVEELIAMAMVLRNKRMTKSEIMTWVCDTFWYYRKLSVASLVPNIDEEVLPLHGFAVSFPEEFRRAFTKPNTAFSTKTSKGRTRCKLGTGASRLGLYNKLSIRFNPAYRPFRFFDLPPELRTIIYEMAMTVAAGGILVSGGCNRRTDYSQVSGECFVRPAKERSHSAGDPATTFRMSG